MAAPSIDGVDGRATAAAPARDHAAFQRWSAGNVLARSPFMSTARKLPIRKEALIGARPSPAAAPLPRVYDEFDDGDTRLNPNALFGDALGPLPVPSNAGRTVVMPSALGRMPIAPELLQRGEPAPVAGAASAPCLPVAGAPSGVVQIRPAPEARRPATTKSAPGGSGRELTTVDVAVAAVGVTIFGVLVALLWLYLT